LNKFTFRKFHEDDKNFVINSWLKSYSKYSEAPGDVFYHEHHKLITSFIESLTDPENVIMIACDIDDTDVIYGYVAYQKNTVPIIHYIFVKELFRKLNIAKELMSYPLESTTTPIIISHLTPKGRFLLKDKYFFNPYKFYKGKF
jgi:hypothetical protein